MSFKKKIKICAFSYIILYIPKKWEKKRLYPISYICIKILIKEKNRLHSMVENSWEKLRFFFWFEIDFADLDAFFTYARL